MDVQVYPGRDGWLFLAGRLATLYDREASLLPGAKLRDRVTLIEACAACLEKMADISI